MIKNISYRRATQADIDVMTDMLFLLYNDEGQAPDLSREELLAENEQLLADINQIFFLAFDGCKAVGVSHGSLRREYVNGTNDGIKGYLEAIYVLPEYRKNGIAAELDKIIGRWAVQNGCREMASDCLLENTGSYNFHLKIGYEETERNIFFLKTLEPKDDAVHFEASNKPPIRLTTERLVLRDYKETDLAEMYRLWSDKDTMYYLDDILCHSIDDAAKYLNIGMANSDGHYFCITEKSSDNFIGSIGYTISEATPFGSIVHMGYMMFPEYHGRGYMTEAVKKMIDFAFTHDGCCRITTGCHKENIASRRVIEKAGFRKEAEKINAVYHDGKMKDRLEYAINKDEGECLCSVR